MNNTTFQKRELLVRMALRSIRQDVSELPFYDPEFLKCRVEFILGRIDGIIENSMSMKKELVESKGNQYS